MHLTVIHPFENYQRGDKIKDEAEMAKILEGENVRHVVRTSEPQQNH
jgi:hypothetical protein